jgi:hypothetical protein
MFQRKKYGFKVKRNKVAVKTVVLIVLILEVLALNLVQRLVIFGIINPADVEREFKCLWGGGYYSCENELVMPFDKIVFV